MAKSPDRTADVYFLGAGFSKAFGLPNTAELLSRVHALSDGSQHWGVSRDMGGRLQSAYKYFYPDEGKNFQPPVSDFFTVLSAYEDIGAGLPQGFPDTSLLNDLKFAIASIICSDLKAIDPSLDNENHALDKIIQPGNLVITSNWDYLIERACVRREVPFRLQWNGDESAVNILKLHGSVDWTEKSHSKQPWGTNNYYRLEDLTGPHNNRHDTLQGKSIARCHSIENWTRAYQKIKGATEKPFMLAMARGKSSGISPLREIWTNAYHVISRAKNLHLIGYSIPDDDVEIRTLLRAGVRRGNKNPKVHVVNPAPSVHVRVRQQILDKVNSDYSSIRGV